jgi:hypothetical protein
MARPQNMTSFFRSGTISPVSHEPAKKSHAPMVTRWKTPTNSSTVVWFVRSSSLSYRP